jgi:hypothetical protein
VGLTGCGTERSWPFFHSEGRAATQATNLANQLASTSFELIGREICQARRQRVVTGYASCRGQAGVLDLSRCSDPARSCHRSSGLAEFRTTPALPSSQKCACRNFGL